MEDPGQTVRVAIHDNPWCWRSVPANYDHDPRGPTHSKTFTVRDQAVQELEWKRTPLVKFKKQDWKWTDTTDSIILPYIYCWVCKWKKIKNRWLFGNVTRQNVIVSCTCALGQHTAKRRKKVHDTITFLLVTLPNIQRLNFFFTHRLNNKPFLIWLLTTPPHLKYVATLPCNLSLMASFADINVSQGSVATYARCGGIFDIRLTANLPRNLPVKTNS